MPTPSNAPATSTGENEVQDPVLFAELTERQAMPQTTTTIKGMAKKQRLQVEKVGVISRVRLQIKWKFKTKAASKPVLNPGFPYKMLAELAMQANGVTGIIDCSAMTLAQRRDRVYRNPTTAIENGPAAGTTLEAAKSYEGTFVVEVPIAHDMESLIGSLLAQNEETNLSFLLTWASEAEMMHSGEIEGFEGEIVWGSTVFSIGSTVVGKKEMTVLPDLSAFHGITEQEPNLNGTGNQKIELTRTEGQLLCLTFAILNKAGGQATLKPQELTKIQLEYGGNKDPLVWLPASELIEENADDYNGALSPGGVQFAAIDNERDNSHRDMIIPADLVEFRAVLGVPTSFTPEEARTLVASETLYPAV